MPRNDGSDRDRHRRDRRDDYDKRSRRRARSRSYSRSRSPIDRSSRDYKRRRETSPSIHNDLEATLTEEHRNAREQRALDEEAEKRRKRIEAWQEQRRKLQDKEGEGEPTTTVAAPSTQQDHQDNNNTRVESAIKTEKGGDDDGGDGEVGGGWNLDDDDDDGDGHAHAHTTNNNQQEDNNNKTTASLLPTTTTTTITTNNNSNIDGVDAYNATHSLPKLGQLKSPTDQNNIINNNTTKPNNNIIDDDHDDVLDKLIKKEINTTNAMNNTQHDHHQIEEKKEDMDADDDDDDIDPLDAFMAQQILPEVQQTTTMNPSTTTNNNNAAKDKQHSSKRMKKRRRTTNRNLGFLSDSSDDEGGKYSDDLFGDDDELHGMSEDDDEAWAKKVQAGRLSKGDKLGIIDHSTIDYPSFRRNFYIEVPELARMSQAEVDAYRKQLDGIRVRGKDLPKPIKTWNQAGLSARIIDVLKRSGFETPLPIQAQAIPVIMNGRDCMGIAKTGSGKTLAFVLPMLRHIKDQPSIVSGDGPIALIMAPTRELVTQIGKEVKRFSRAVGLSCTCVYGGSGIANQISELKRGTEIVVCTPGRMIDILVTGAGKITNLRRVTYLVMDEADRMFDMGFEPQIMRIVNNIRPDRQTVLFSATFPKSVEVLARQVLTNPVEIQVGGRSVVNPDITQYVEIRQPEERFLRLLELLGEWYERGKLLVFVASQDKCDTLFRDLLRAGYPCLSLHGGKDQSDRESTISDFKSSVCNVLVATSVAARGLDVKDLVLVVNYDCPNHHEDYVHRVGRTGRAGNKGTAVTFISPEEDQFAPDLVKALKESNAPVPADLAALAEGFEKKKKEGTAKTHGSGFGGSGFKFDAAEEQKAKDLKKKAAKEFGIIEESESEDEDDIKEVMVTEGADANGTTAAGGSGANGQAAATEEPPAIDITTLSAEAQARIKAAQALAEKLTAAPLASTPAQAAALNAAAAAPPQPTPAASNPVLAAAQAAAQALSMKLGGPAAATAVSAQAMAAAAAAMGASAQPQQVKHFQAELEINDFPQQARWKVTHRQTISDFAERLGAIIVVKGRYVKPGTMMPEGERKLYLSIEGTTADIVRKAKAELKRLVEESTEKALRREVPAAGRFSIM